MTNLPFRNQQFMVGDLVMPHPDYHQGCENVGVVTDIIEGDWNVVLVVRWQQPFVNKFGAVFWEEKMPHYMYERIA